ncbi:maleylpyruvate isomerase family mycothiol-dependent enzyme [Saccharopolyspora erythraea]|uniref:maleylpyruvate isomerase family mycothiol-dependent enzyme n=1 Tax=Saccharopolyspora erythraea TaxID=1836 RepID=UPI001BAC6A36|nr:maleylpyruvate isomerase family mycothiol-dependent enzyme [Saccharopolyspora erythraea]QUH01290.1 maleylpyruvate isomerase family mycothiol-dependent enzyme [Saccharopolyspora erythraea]
MSLSTEDVVAEVRAGHARIAALVEGLGDAQARGGSALPGWSRGHVLTHLADLARAFTRVTEHALRGRLVEVYEGGRPARDASIEAGSGRSAAELRAEVVESAEELDNAWKQVDSEGWQRPVTYRDGVLLDVLHCRWREVEIHAADLALGRVPADWSPDFCAHALDFLAPRTPEGMALTLRPDDSDLRRQWGSGEPVEVRGALTDLTAWMAGRTPTGPLVSSSGAAPQLGPWP